MDKLNIKQFLHDIPYMRTEKQFWIINPRFEIWMFFYWKIGRLCVK
jgi:hypothetical protein